MSYLSVGVCSTKRVATWRHWEGSHSCCHLYRVCVHVVNRVNGVVLLPSGAGLYFMGYCSWTECWSLFWELWLCASGLLFL